MCYLNSFIEKRVLLKYIQYFVSNSYEAIVLSIIATETIGKLCKEFDLEVEVCV